MRKFKFEVLVAMLLSGVMSLAVGVEPQPVDYLVFETRDEHPTCQGFKSVFIANKNTSSRIFATIKIESDFTNYYWLDSERNAVLDQHPKYANHLLQPGEKKRVGCDNLFLGKVGNSVNKLAFKYTKEGAYYPKPNLVIPKDRNPVDYVRFFEHKISGFPVSVCPLPGYTPDTLQGIVMVNLHPTRTIAVTYTNSTPGRHPVLTENLAPLNQRSVACTNEWPNIKFASFRFLQ